MSVTKRQQILSAVAVSLAIIAAIVLYSRGKDAKPPPSASGYYTGPMKSKGGTTYGTDDGQQVNAPPAPAPSDSTAATPKGANSLP